MNGSSRIRVFIAVGILGIGLGTFFVTSSHAEPAASESQQATVAAPDTATTDAAKAATGGCMEDGKSCCGACQKRAALLGDKAAASCPCKAAAAARAAAAAEAEAGK
jgi:hypothetical protein